MSKYVGTDGKFNHQKWQRQQTLGELNEATVSQDFHKGWSKTFGMFKEYYQHLKAKGANENELYKLHKIMDGMDKNVNMIGKKIETLGKKYFK